MIEALFWMIALVWLILILLETRPYLKQRKEIRKFRKEIEERKGL